MPREQRTVFDEVADVYDRARPGYPDALFDDVLAFAGLARGERMLEIGAGTGKATRGFVARGVPMLCLEPGERMAAVLRAGLPAGADVRIAPVRFEDWPLEAGRFGLVAAGQSFHWVDPEAGLARVTRALRPGGALALFGNRPLRGDTPLHRDVEACYVEHAHALAADVLASYGARSYPDEIRDTGAYGTPFTAEYPFHREYEAEGYLELLSTQSDHRMLAEGDRRALLASIREAIEGHGGSIRVDYRSQLTLARRQDARS